MISMEMWEKICGTFEEAFGVGCLKLLPIQNTAFLFLEKGKPIAMIKSPVKDGDQTKLHFRISAMPGTAAFIGCLLQRHVDFLIADHYEIDPSGNWLNESQALRYFMNGDYKKNPPGQPREFLPMSETEQDRVEISELKKKDLLN